MRDVFTRVPTLHVANCSVRYSVDELYCCTLSTSSAKGEQQSKAYYLDRTTGYAKRERQVRLSRRRADDRALTVSGPQGNYFTLETAVKRLSTGMHKLLIVCVLCTTCKCEDTHYIHKTEHRSIQLAHARPQCPAFTCVLQQIFIGLPNL